MNNRPTERSKRGMIWGEIIKGSLLAILLVIAANISTLFVFLLLLIVLRGSLEFSAAALVHFFAYFFCVYYLLKSSYETHLAIIAFAICNGLMIIVVLALGENFSSLFYVSLIAGIFGGLLGWMFFMLKKRKFRC